MKFNVQFHFQRNKATIQTLDTYLKKLQDFVTFNEVVGLLPPAARRRIQLERPQEVAGILKVLANSHDLVDDVLNADHAVLAKDILDDVIGRNGDTPSLNLIKKRK